MAPSDNRDVDGKDTKAVKPLTDLPVRDAAAEDVIGGLGTGELSDSSLDGAEADAASNILKTRHDTAKNSISNVR